MQSRDCQDDARYLFPAFDGVFHGILRVNAFESLAVLSIGKAADFLLDAHDSTTRGQQGTGTQESAGEAGR